MRVGIFGYGLAARVFHAPIAKLAGFEIAAIQTNNQERINEAKSDFPDAVICSSSDELLANVSAYENLYAITTAIDATANGFKIRTWLSFYLKRMCSETHKTLLSLFLKKKLKRQV